MLWLIFAALSPGERAGWIEPKTRKEEGIYLEMRLSQTLPTWAFRNTGYHYFILFPQATRQRPEHHGDGPADEAVTVEVWARLKAV